ncbi:hypothetical protein K3495_g4601 [Podosphaera aphanis]|nr:hypothetical protein K3495_g4601 [Podosphaera aphanis]
MGSQFGSFRDLCRKSTLPVCNLFPGFSYANPSRFRGSCQLIGMPLSGGRHIGNLGSMIFAFIAILVAIGLIALSQRKKAAVGRREMQIFLFTYLLIEVCEIFTIGLFPLDDNIRIAFTAMHLGLIIAGSWILMLNAVVGFQILDDGTPFSVGLILISASIIFIGTAYIALDTRYSWTGHFDASLSGQNKNEGLYVLYQVLPLIFLIIFFLLETFLVLRILGEMRPMIFLISAAILFAIGQVFNYVISIRICNSSSGKINGSLFETFFTLLSVIMLWIFWSNITEDDWPSSPANTYP